MRHQLLVALAATLLPAGALPAAGQSAEGSTAARRTPPTWVLAGVRYAGPRSRLQVDATAIEHDSGWVALSRVDLLGGIGFRAPLGSRVAIPGRGDVARLGSQVTWNLEGDLAFRASEHWVLGEG